MPADEVVRLVTGVLDAAGLPLDEVAELATVEARAAEPGLRRAAALLGVPLAAYSASALALVRVPHPSQVAQSAVGTPSVAEAAALLRGGRLVVPKTVSAGRPARATCAVARLPDPAPGPAVPPAGARRSPAGTARQATPATAGGNGPRRRRDDSTGTGRDEGTAGPRETPAGSPRQNGRGPAEGWGA
ncbi:cobalamin biosynthesis protein [Streptomyces sp. TS71-3]|uniref:cobalamin biosynthesis protein n=1 Tax=Streptomyces sp. TS71-3 TaxID=2733862 RepID=UPI0035AC21AD